MKVENSAGVGKGEITAPCSTMNRNDDVQPFELRKNQNETPSLLHGKIELNAVLSAEAFGPHLGEAVTVS
jgi:hypothetical protein